MSRKHPTQSELEKKAENINAERDKVSNFRPFIRHNNPDNFWEPGEVERDNKGLILGERRPIPRTHVMAWSKHRACLKATHDAQGMCSRPDCAFRNLPSVENSAPDILLLSSPNQG